MQILHLDQDNNFELPRIDEVRIQIYTQFPPFDFLDVNFHVDGQTIEPSLLSASFDANMELLELISQLSSYLNGSNEVSINLENHIFKIWLNGIEVDFGMVYGDIVDYGFLDDILKIKLKNLITKIYEYLSKKDIAESIDPLTRERTSEHGSDDLIETGGNVAMWIEYKKVIDGHSKDLPEDKKIQFCLDYIIEQLTIYVDNEQIQPPNFDLLKPLILEIITRFIVSHGNPIGTTEIERTAHDLLVQMDNFDSLIEGYTLYDEYWTESNSPKAKILPLLNGNEDLYLFFCNELMNVGVFSHLGSEDENSSNDDDDWGPLIPEPT